MKKRMSYTHKYNLLLALLLTTTVSLFGQKSFNGGFLAGISTSQIGGDGYGGFDKAGLIGGFFTHIPISEKSAWMMELRYIDKGSVKPSDPENGNYTYRKIQLSYVEVPVLYIFKLGKFNYEAGVSYGRLIRQHFFDETGEYFPIESHLFRKWELASQLGLNYQANERFRFNVRYSISLWKIRDHWESFGYNIYGGSHNTVLAFSAYYNILKNDKE